MRGLQSIEVGLLLLAVGMAAIAIAFLSSSKTRTAGATLLGGVLVAVGTFRTIQLNREGQITERFTRAIDQIGDPERTEVRVGGIYALERIARDSKRDRGPIAETLTVFLRERARAPDDEEPLDPRHRPSVDIQAAVTVLGRLSPQSLSGDHLDLSRVDLRNAVLEHLHFEGAVFWNADLRGAQAYDARFEGADFGGARLNDANFWGAHLERAKFVGARLWGAKFPGAYLRGADFSDADLCGVRFKDRDDGNTVTAALTDATFTNATSNAQTVWADVRPAGVIETSPDV